MRDIVFLVADGQMEQTVKGFFDNPAYERRLQCNRFEFNAQEDLFTHPGNDPGVFNEAHQFLNLYSDSHRYAVIMLDFNFNDNLKVKDIDQFRQELSLRMQEAGWPKERFYIMAINPELEVLMWQEDTRGLERILGYAGQEGSLRQWLADKGLWPTDVLKPPEPKKAIDFVRAQSWGPSITRPQIFKAVAKNVSFRRCQDDSFVGLWQQLQVWYPVQY
ncbi:methylation-associated defense system protein MAD4 [Vibrio lentus]|uniref:methylation-associated defense system protein MAD4 n=1 Tax=Vibrio lentus TaxID=136468 RepID=UPI000C8296A1|nr:hypothetical protein [Vibrio lentus]PMH08663.1 hypothetical protein BCU76_04785 [Vibrio lentus]